MSKLKQKHKKSELYRFLIVFLILLAYMAFTIKSYGLKQGLGVTALTWAFFVFATPIADGGFLLAFPIRIIAGVRMLYTQIGVWVFGAILVLSFLIFRPGIFEKTALLELFHKILVTPWPLWLIILLSGIGTYVSIKFDDDIVDVAAAKHKKLALIKTRKKFYYTLAVFSITLLLYIMLLKITHTHIKII